MAESAGARTQLTGLVGAVALAVILLVAPGDHPDLPTSALAAVVIAAAISLIDVDLAPARGASAARSSSSRLSALPRCRAAGVLWGIAIAVGLSCSIVRRRAWHPYDAVLGRVDGLKGYHDTIRLPDAKHVPGLLLFRFDAPLFFANADVFRDRLLDARAQPTRPCAASS